MSRLASGSGGSARLFQAVSLGQLQAMTVVFPLGFVVLHHYLMIGPLHPFFHSLFGFLALMVPLGVAVYVNRPGNVGDSNP